jgi:protein TonB
MNIAHTGSSRTSQLVMLSLLIHAVVIYYVAIAFQIVPPFVPPEREATPMRTVIWEPPPPLPPKADDPIEKSTFKQPRPDRPVTPTNVRPLPPSSPEVGPSTSATPPGAANGVVGANGPISEPPIEKVRPAYPPFALNEGIEGRVVLSITILPDGSVTDVRVVSANPAGHFEKSATRAVERWRYKPSNVTRTNVIVHVDYVLT